MKVSKNWLQELVDLKVPIKEVETLLPLRTIATKEITDDFIELDMKGYNRADLLSLRGVAYEIAAITDSQIKFTEPSENEYYWTSKDFPKTPVTTDKELNPVQAVAKIEGLKVQKSPDTWVKKLEESGMRSVNNIVDVTNLIMLEYGHPLHAFDASIVKNDTIDVRRARNGEEIITLDEKIRKLTAEDIVLADSEKALDIAGIMGGKDTGIKNSTTTILLSASFFDPNMIRKTARRLGLGTESTKRFYHGLTKKRLFQALNAAIKMLEQIGGKVTAINIIGEKEDKVKTIKLTQEKINSLIGIDIPAEDVKKYLESLGFHLSGVNVNSRVVTVPYWRLDIDLEEDLIEEIARMYGYEKIPPQELQGEPPEKIDQSLFDLIYKLKSSLADTGLTEVQTYSFYSTDVLNNLNYKTDGLVKIANPISSETEYLRNHIWPNLVEVVGKNVRWGYKDIAIFELGKAYYKAKDAYLEEYKLSIALLNSSENPTAELYQIFKNITESLKLGIEIGEEIGESADRFHPVRYLYLMHKDKILGKIGEVHPRILNKFGIEKRVAILEISIAVTY